MHSIVAASFRRTLNFSLSLGRTLHRGGLNFTLSHFLGCRLEVSNAMASLEAKPDVTNSMASLEAKLEVSNAKASLAAKPDVTNSMASLEAKRTTTLSDSLVRNEESSFLDMYESSKVAVSS